MILKEVGYFNELKHGRKNGPSLKDSISKSPLDNEEKIVFYLTNGIDFISSPGVVRDIFDETRIIGGLSIYTDGTWMWPSDLIYYVENYHVSLPDEFLNYMKSKNWSPPQENEIDFSKLEVLK